MFRLLPVIFMSSLAALPASAAPTRRPQMICAGADGTLAVRNRCRPAETRLTTREELKGDPGENGVLGVYGDGSAGALLVTGAEALEGVNLQFTDITVAASAQLTVPSGTILRCTGTATIAGSLVVTPGAAGGEIPARESTATLRRQRLPEAGMAAGAAMNAEVSNTGAAAGGLSARNLSSGEAVRLLLPQFASGGGGGASLSGDGGDGGGGLLIACRGDIKVLAGGVVRANGAAGGDGAGGGSGGLVVLASAGQAVNAGTIEAHGGAGGVKTADSAPGGGGAGGVIHLLSPAAPVAGALSVIGGAAGTGGGAVSETERSGGGGGAAFGGTGGIGGGVLGDGSIFSASPGAAGQTFVTAADPSALLVQ